MPITAIARFDLSGTLSITDNTTVSRSLTVNNFGQWGRITDIYVTLNGLSHTFPGDLDFLLLGPGGTNLEFWSDAGGSTPISNGDFIIRESVAFALLPDFGGIASGTYRPADYGEVERSSNWGLAPGLVINHPATGGTATFASAFGDAWVDNSTWSLYVRDDAAADVGSLASWGVQFNYRFIVKPDDFDGNNKSDILWQSNDGIPAMWSMNGASATAIGGVGPFGPFPFNPGPSWHIKANGDFNDDGKSDILWQDDNGTPSIWMMNGFAAQSTGAAGPFNPGPSWHIKATGDFNFDGPADILWQNDDGTPAIWLMNGFAAQSMGAAGPFNPGPSWQIKATGDFNGDGRSDILWQGADGTPAIWLMNGLTVLFNGPAGSFNPGPTWQIKGTGDFNNDGMSDIVWQNTNGQAAIWLMNGVNATTVGAVGPFNPGPSWQIKGTGDYNGNQKSDILWQGADGTPAIWFMDGMNFIGGSAAGSFNPGPDWHVIA
jgi:subtilisin-like proprotein convertase family protein